VPIETYIRKLLDPQLRTLGLNDRQRATVSRDVRWRLTSLLSHWHDRLFRRTILFPGVEEASFYEPLAASLDIRALIVVTVRNSLIEDLGATHPSHPGLRLSRPVLRNAQMPMIMRAAVEYFQGIDLDAIELRLSRRDGRDVFGALPVQYPHAWHALLHLSDPCSVERSLEPVSAPPSDLPSPSRRPRKAASSALVESGIDTAFHPSTALLELIVLWYPRFGEEDTDGCACQSGGVAGAAGVFGLFPGAFPTTGGPRRPGAVYDGAAHGASQQELRYDRPGRARDQ
jgi:hypothetical protein